jgi:hypothetical protein
MKLDPISTFIRQLAPTLSRRLMLGLAAGAASGVLLTPRDGAAGDNSKRRRRRRRRRRQRRRNDQCVPITPPFSGSFGSCTESRDCCDGGTCCTFNDEGGPESLCFNLLTHTTACGLTCETVVNCLNTAQICVNGECVDP